MKWLKCKQQSTRKSVISMSLSFGPNKKIIHAKKTQNKHKKHKYKEYFNERCK